MSPNSQVKTRPVSAELLPRDPKHNVVSTLLLRRLHVVSRRANCSPKEACICLCQFGIGGAIDFPGFFCSTTPLSEISPGGGELRNRPKPRTSKGVDFTAPKRVPPYESVGPHNMGQLLQVCASKESALHGTDDVEVPCRLRMHSFVPLLPGALSPHHLRSSRASSPPCSGCLAPWNHKLLLLFETML